MKLRIGVIGPGEAWETRHKMALRSLGDRFEIRGIAGEVSHLAERAARDFEVPAVDGVRALVHRTDIDAVLILSSGWYGPLTIAAACDSGKAIYCGESLDMDSRRLAELKSRVEQSGIAFMAEFPRRHCPATLRLKELMATRLGAPRLMFGHVRKPVSGADHAQRKLSLAARELVELIDWCRYLVGRDPTSVLGIRHGAEACDYEMLSLDFSAAGQPGTGPMAQISCGGYLRSDWPEAISFRPPAELQVSCENGAAFMDLPNNLIWFDEVGRHRESLDSERPVGEQLLTHFHRAVTSLVRKTDEFDDVWKAMTVLQAARESFREGHRVELPFGS